MIVREIYLKKLDDIFTDAVDKSLGMGCFDDLYVKIDDLKNIIEECKK